LLSITVVKTIGILTISLLMGFLFFYITTNEPKDVKKKQLENLLSFIINFIIFIWIGKIIVRIDIFVDDPLAILAYPSNVAAFYVATVLLAMNVSYTLFRRKQKAKELFNTFVPVLIATTFIFEFFQFVYMKYERAWILVLFLAILLLVLVLMQGKVAQHHANLLVFIAWITGQIILSTLIKYPVIFGYQVHSLFFISLFILVFIYFIYTKKRRKV